MNSFDRAQRAYDRMQPDDNDLGYKECPECEGFGKVPVKELTIWQRFKQRVFGTEYYVDCERCSTSGEVERTMDDVADDRAAHADYLRDCELDRRMGL